MAQPSGAAPRISVIICTRDRVVYLRQAVKSVLQQTLPVDQYEIIVVNNGAVDPSWQTVAEFDRTTVRYINEPVVGLSRARNTGFRAARAPVVAFLDDDAIASPGWLENILAAFREFPDAACVGGRIELLWTTPAPEWLHERLHQYFGQLDCSPVPLKLDGARCLVGANIAFLKHLLEELGGFSLRLGRKGSKLLSGEELLLQGELKRRGHSCVYYPSAAVKHCVLPDRLSKEWFIARAFWQGVTDSVQESFEFSRFHPRRAVSVLRACYRMANDARQFWLQRRDQRMSFVKRCELYHKLGYVANFLGISG